MHKNRSALFLPRIATLSFAGWSSMVKRKEPTVRKYEQGRVKCGRPGDGRFRGKHRRLVRRSDFQSVIVTGLFPR